MSRRPRVLTWHVHGSYLYYLSHADCEFILPVKEDRADGYGGRVGAHPWGDNVTEVDVDEIARQPLDLVLCQSRRNWTHDRFEILSSSQLRLPTIYLEHDPPREHPTDTRHVVDDPNVLLVHVTHFNELMWDNGRTPTRVIEHGVVEPGDVRYSGELERGLVVINELRKRGRRLGSDVFDRAREHIPLDLIGIAAAETGGLGEVPHDELPRFSARYRFFFNPIRYTSLGLAVCEAMMLGLPIVALATTEMVSVIRNQENGYLSTDVDELVERMKELIGDRQLAARLGAGARRTARERFSIERFAKEWGETLREVAAGRGSERALPLAG